MIEDFADMMNRDLFESLKKHGFFVTDIPYKEIDPKAKRKLREMSLLIMSTFDKE